jgi:hypothetical protein
MTDQAAADRLLEPEDLTPPQMVALLRHHFPDLAATAWEAFTTEGAWEAWISELATRCRAAAAPTSREGA